MAKVPRNPKGGWLPPNLKELAKFQNEIQQESNRRFGVDEDGSYCVVVGTVDRSREELSDYPAIPRDITESPYHPYGRKQWNESAHTEPENEVRNEAILENRLEILRRVDLHFRLASDRLQRLLREQECDLWQEIDRSKKDRERRIQVLESLKEKWLDPVAWYRKKGSSYTVDEQAMTYTFVPLGKTVKMVRPESFDADMKELKRLKAYRRPKKLVL